MPEAEMQKLTWTILRRFAVDCVHAPFSPCEAYSPVFVGASICTEMCILPVFRVSLKCHAEETRYRVSSFGSASKFHILQTCLHQPGTVEVESDCPSNLQGAWSECSGDISGDAYACWVDVVQSVLLNLGSSSSELGIAVARNRPTA